MKRIFCCYLLILIQFIFTTPSYAGKDPIGWKVIIPFPPIVTLNETVEAVYQFTNNLPFKMPTPLFLALTQTQEIDLGNDTCSGERLNPGESCTASVILSPISIGTKSFQLKMEYGKNVVPLPKMQTRVVSGTSGVLRGTTYGTLTRFSFPSTPYTLVFQFTNIGSATLTNISLTKAHPPQFTETISPNPCGATLNAGSSCEVTYNFEATAPNTYHARVTMNTNAGSLTLHKVTTVKSSPPPANTRVFYLENRCPFEVWFAFIGGAAPTTQTCTAGPCPPGSTCNQNNGNCYFNGPAPVHGSSFRLAGHGGSNLAYITDYQTTAGGTVWSGNASARLACSNITNDPRCGLPNTGCCQVADCGAGRGNCPPGGSMSPPVTLAEFTLLHGSNDAYDVEVINGFSIPVEMQPVNPATTPSQYFCGSPGAVTPNNSGLAICTWNFSPPSPNQNDFVWVLYNANASPCGSCKPHEVCGMSYNLLANSFVQNVCGKHLGYWSPDQICGKHATNPPAEFLCGATIHSTTSGVTYTFEQLYGCAIATPTSLPLNSCYTYPNVDCCGCVTWSNVLPNPDKAKVTELGPACTIFNTQTYTPPGGSSESVWTNSNVGSPMGTVYNFILFLKTACPTIYSFPFDDETSSFKCPFPYPTGTTNNTNYKITFCPNNVTGLRL